MNGPSSAMLRTLRSVAATGERARAARARGARRTRAAIGAAVALLVALPFVLHAFAGQREVYWLYIVAQFFTLALVAVSLDLLMGRTGQISLGHNGFFAIGAYTAAILSARYGVDLVVAMALAGLASAVASLILGFPAARLRGHYLGIVTFGFGIAIDQVALKWDSLTGGDQGVHLKPATILHIPVGSPLALYFVCLGTLIVAVYLVRNLTHTRVGRSFAAVRDSEVAAAAMGVPIARTKVIAFVCSAFLTGIAGSLYAFLAGFIAPEDFGTSQAMLFLAMVVIGGSASIAGAIGGALVVDAVQQAASTVSGLTLAILGGVIVLVTLFFPRGIKGVIARFGEEAPEVDIASAPGTALHVANERAAHQVHETEG